MFGLRVHEAVLAGGDANSGCTVHLVDHEYDHGPIIDQRVIPVLAADTPETLARRVAVEERELYPAVLQLAADQGVPALAEAARARAERPCR